MAGRGKREESGPPKFPRRRWSPGQQERVEPPARGGPYDRARQRREAEEAIEDALETGEGGPSDGPSPGAPPSRAPTSEPPGPESPDLRAPRGARGRRRPGPARGG